MKKIIVFLVSGCCSMILLMACDMREKGTEDIVAEPIKAGDEIDNSETGKTEELTDAVEQEIIYPEGYQTNAIRFYEQDYVFLDKILNEKEKFVIEMHLIRQMSWPEVTKLYEERYGTADSRSERTLKRMQKKAITKMEDFIRSLQVGFNALI